MILEVESHSLERKSAKKIWPESTGMGLSVNLGTKIQCNLPHLPCGSSHESPKGNPWAQLLVITPFRRQTGGQAYQEDWPHLTIVMLNSWKLDHKSYVTIMSFLLLYLNFFRECSCEATDIEDINLYIYIINSMEGGTNPTQSQAQPHFFFLPCEINRWLWGRLGSRPWGGGVSMACGHGVSLLDSVIWYHWSKMVMLSTANPQPLSKYMGEWS